MRAAPLLALAILAGCATPPGVESPAAERPAAACPPSRDWGAHIDLAREGSNRLRRYVHGEVDVPAGMVATLRAGPRDRMDPPTQRFALELRRGRGAGGRQVVGGSVGTPPIQYRQILVTCGGETIGRIDGIDVEIAD